MGFLALTLLIGSGLVLYAVFDTSVAGAHASVDALRHWPLGLGRVVRGVHHYAADLLMLVMFLHILREWLHGHERGARRFHWLTGVPLVGFCFVSAIGGFWLAWDELGLYSALATAEWIDVLPLVGTPLARNFLTAGAVSDRLFSLFIFVHVGVPLLFVFGLWFHIQRLSHVAIWPPRRLSLGLIAMLVALALLQPALSHAPAALDRVPDSLRLDWLLLWLHPLVAASSPLLVWGLVALAGLWLLGVPFLRQPPRAQVAVVDPDHCSGCRFCFEDCPYAAVTMVPHSNQREGQWMARVDADLCVGCGICAGACPSSTPFRGTERLITGIDMPQLPVDSLREQVRRSLAESPAAAPVLVFACEHGADAQHLAADDVAVHSLLCAAQLPPSLLEYALREGAAGVLVASCPEGGCEFRLGPRWTVERFAGLRRPYLRQQMPRERLELVGAAAGDEAALSVMLQRLRTRLNELPEPTVENPS